MITVSILRYAIIHEINRLSELEIDKRIDLP